MKNLKKNITEGVKNVNWPKLGKNLLLIVTILGAIYAIPNVINYFIPYPNIWDENSNIGNWMSYLGGYVGSVVGGIIGGFVAFIAARYQINIQKRNQDEIEIIKQFPILFALQDELRTLEVSLQIAQNRAIRIYYNIAELAQNQKADNEQLGAKISQLLERQHFPIGTLNNEIWQKIDCIRDMNLYLELFLFQRRFAGTAEVLEYDVERAETQYRVVSEEVTKKGKDPITNMYPDRYEQYLNLKEMENSLSKQISVFSSQKENCLDDIRDGKSIAIVKHLLTLIDKQLSEIKALQDKRSGNRILK